MIVNNDVKFSYEGDYDWLKNLESGDWNEDIQEVEEIKADANEISAKEQKMLSYNAFKKPYHENIAQVSSIDWASDDTTFFRRDSLLN